MTQRHVVRQERQRKVACPAKAREAYFFSLCFTMRTGGPQKDFSIVSSMTPSNGGNGPQHRSASSSSLQGEKERGDRGPAPRRSAADAAPKKNGDQAKRARALRIHGVMMKHPSIVPCMVKGAGNTAGELRTAGPYASLNMLNRKRSGRGPGHMWLR